MQADANANAYAHANANANAYANANAPPIRVRPALYLPCHADAEAIDAPGREGLAFGGLPAALGGLASGRFSLGIAQPPARPDALITGSGNARACA